MNAISETLATLRSKRDELSVIILGLERLFGAELGTVPSETKPAKPATIPAPGATKRQEAATHRKSRKLDAAIEACRRLSEPFNSGGLAAESGLSTKGAASAIYRWEGRGWIRKSAPGQWVRTKTFGGDVSATASSRAMLDEIHRDIDAAKPKED
jgi:hypothetical protein